MGKLLARFLSRVIHNDSMQKEYDSPISVLLSNTLTKKTTMVALTRFTDGESSHCHVQASSGAAIQILRVYRRHRHVLTWIASSLVWIRERFHVDDT